MDDTVKNIFIGLCSFLVIRGTFEGRARHGAEKQLREAFHETGHVHVRVAERGLLGYYSNDIWAVDAFGSGMQAEELPFAVYPRGGWKGSIRHLRLHLTDFTLKGLPVRRLEADVPFATYDLGWAGYKDRLHLRSAGIGTARVEVGAEGLQYFAIRKYRSILSDVSVSFERNEVFLSGNYALFGVPTAFVATGTLRPRAGRYVDLFDPVVTVNGIPLSERNANFLLGQLNPLLDIDNDLGLGGFFSVETIAIGDQSVTMSGSMTIPLAQPAAPK